MSARDNFNQAMNDMFGVGKGSGSNSQPKAEKEYEAPDYSKDYSYAPQAALSTYLAVGTVIEGTIYSKGDVEIAGTLKGNVEAEGKVTLHTDVEGNVSARDLNIPSCKLVGDVRCTGRVNIGADADITGNIIANEITLAGTIHGDMDVKNHISLQSTSTVYGNIATNTMAMERGAIIRGGIEMREPVREPQYEEDDFLAEDTESEN